MQMLSKLEFNTVLNFMTCFFAATYKVYIIHSSYFISGFFLCGKHLSSRASWRMLCFLGELRVIGGGGELLIFFFFGGGGLASVNPVFISWRQSLTSTDDPRTETVKIMCSNRKVHIMVVGLVS